MVLGTPRHPWTLYFSGAIQGGTCGGCSAIGWVLKDSRALDVVAKSTVIKKDYAYVQTSYVALIRGILEALERDVGHLTVYGDSRVVCNQINQKWGIKSRKLVQYYDRAIDLMDRFCTFSVELISVKNNQQAVDLATDARDEYMKCLHLLECSSDSDYDSSEYSDYFMA